MLLKAALAGPALASPGETSRGGGVEFWHCVSSASSLFSVKLWHRVASAASFGVKLLQRQVSALATHTGPGPRRLFCGTDKPPRSFSGPRTRAALPATAKAVAHRQSFLHILFLNTQSPVYFSTLCFNVQSPALSSTGGVPPGPSTSESAGRAPLPRPMRGRQRRIANYN